MSVLRKEKGFYRSIFEATVCAKLDEDKTKLIEYQKWMNEFPVELDDREQQILDRKEIEIQRRTNSTIIQSFRFPIRSATNGERP